MRIKIKKTNKNINNVSEEQVLNSLFLIADVLDNYELDEAKKKLCRRGSPYHGKNGEFSTKKDAKSWSVRVSGKDCDHGQLRLNPRRWTKRDCGRKSRHNPNVKADYKCKDGKRTDEYLAPVNCKVTDIDKSYAPPTEKKPAAITIDKKLDCGVKNMKVNKVLYDKIQKVRNYEKQFKGGKVYINKQFLDRVLDYIEDNPPKVKEDNKKMSKDDYRDSIFAGWRDLLQISRGIY